MQKEFTILMQKKYPCLWKRKQKKKQLGKKCEFHWHYSSEVSFFFCDYKKFCLIAVWMKKLWGPEFLSLHAWKLMLPLRKFQISTVVLSMAGQQLSSKYCISFRMFDILFSVCCIYEFHVCRSSRLATFPDYLVLHMRKFVMEAGWVPKKLGKVSLRIFVELCAFGFL